MLAALPILLLALAYLLAATLLFTAYSAVPGCGPKSPCDAVLSSRFSRLGPLPIAAPATLLYALMLLASLFPQTLPAFLPFASALALACALWFTFLQLAILHKFCIYCTFTHLAASVGSVLILLNVHPLPPILAGIASALLLITLQLLLRPRQYASTDAQTLSIPSPPPNSIPPDAIDLLDGKLRLSRTDWPFLGSPTAALTVCLLYDPTCHDCRQLYRTLLQTTRQHPELLAAIAIPVPFHPGCNPIAPPTASYNPDTCDYARLPLALWHTNPGIYHQYQNWLLAKPAFPPLAEARAWADRLLGVRVSHLFP